MSDEARASQVPPTDSPPKGRPASETIEWSYAIPLLTNRFMLWDLGKVAAISVFALAILVPATGWLVDGEPQFLPWYLLAFALGALVSLFALACLLLGNRYHAVFAVGPSGVAYAAGTRERKVSRLAFIAGLFGRSATAAGSAALATARESEVTPWTDVRSVRMHDKLGVITLMDSWHAVQRLYVPADLFAEVAATVDRYQSEASPPRSTAPARRAWWWYAGWSILCGALTIGMQVWTFVDSDGLVRVGLLGAVAVLLSGLFEGVGRRVFGVIGILGVLANAWALTSSAFETVEGLFGTSYMFTVDTGFLVVAAGSTLALLGLGFWRTLGRIGPLPADTQGDDA